MKVMILGLLLLIGCASPSGTSETVPERALEPQHEQQRCCGPRAEHNAFEVCEFSESPSATCFQWTENYGLIYSTHMPRGVAGASFELGSATPVPDFWGASTRDDTCLLLVHPTTSDVVVSQRAAEHCPAGHKAPQRRSVVLPEPLHGREALITTSAAFEWREQVWSWVDVPEQRDSFEASIRDMFEPSIRLSGARSKPIPPHLIVRVGHWSDDRPRGWPQWADTTVPRKGEVTDRLQALIERNSGAIHDGQ